MAFVAKRVRLLVPSNKAKPSPQIGQALGSLGINMMKFCKEFNAVTTKYADDLPMRVKLYSYNDGSYNFTVHLPATSWFLKKCCKIPKGAGAPGHEEVGMVHVKQLYEIAKLKVGDSEELGLLPVSKMFKTIKHQCKGMGIAVDYRTEADFAGTNKTGTPAAAAAATTAAPAAAKKK